MRFREEIGAPQSPNARETFDRLLANAQQALGEERFVAALAEGRAMTLEQAIAVALAQEAGRKYITVANSILGAG